MIPNQDAPPPGGFKQINFKRHLPVFVRKGAGKYFLAALFGYTFFYHYDLRKARHYYDGLIREAKQSSIILYTLFEPQVELVRLQHRLEVLLFAENNGIELKKDHMKNVYRTTGYYLSHPLTTYE